MSLDLFTIAKLSRIIFEMRSISQIKGNDYNVKHSAENVTHRLFEKCIYFLLNAES